MGSALKAAACLLLFLVLTYEDPFFGSAKWSTPMAFTAPFFHGHPINAWDVSMLLLGAATLLLPARQRQQLWPLNLALAASFTMLLVMTGYGLVRGGNLRMSYFQLLALLRLFLLFPVFVAVFRTRRDLLLLAGTITTAALYRAGACIFGHHYFLANVDVIKFPEFITDHHDSVMWVMVVLGMVAVLFYRFRPSRFLPVAALMAVILLSIHYNDRRLAWVQLVAGLAMAVVVLPPGKVRHRLARAALVALPVLAIYVAVGWNRSTALFAPVRQIRSTFETNDESNRYRDLENIGLVVTLQRTRFLGTGFGHRFEEISDRYSAGMHVVWSEYGYTPHNSVFGFAAFAGAFGFPVIWCFLPVGAFFAARAIAFARQPLDRILGTVAFAYPVVYGIQAYGDMGLQSLKANVLFACSLSTTARLVALTEAWPVRRRERRVLPDPMAEELQLEPDPEAPAHGELP